MSSARVAGVFVITACVVLVCESAALGQAQTTISPIDKFSGPCRAWLYPCEGSYWVCTTEAAYWKFMFHVPGAGPYCPTVYPNPTPPPPPGECQLVNGTCKFVDSTLKCKTWVDQLYGNKCGPVTEYFAHVLKSKGLSVPNGFGQYPAPNQLCLPINNTCQWYNPCISWKGLFTDGNICGSLDEYYAFLYGQPPSYTSLSGQMPQDVNPPGQCAIRKDSCDWYQCTAWLDWCQFSWLCGTVYEKETYQAGPPPPCPPPPPGHHTPVQPGTCRFNITSGQCNFFPNTTDTCNQSIYPPGFVPHCEVLQKQWTYNKTTGQCVEFYYHPCGEDREGYDVFASEQECIKTCMHKDPCKQSIYPPGYMPSCEVVQKQWTYNKTSGKCAEFSYHPCGEDREAYNVFTTEMECMKTCLHKDPCHQSIYPPGFKPTCRLLVNQWTYDAQSGQCVEFEYYPCGEDRDGYDVFATKEECVNTCEH